MVGLGFFLRGAGGRRYSTIHNRAEWIFSSIHIHAPRVAAKALDPTGNLWKPGPLLGIQTCMYCTCTLPANILCFFNLISFSHMQQQFLPPRPGRMKPNNLVGDVKIYLLTVFHTVLYSTYSLFKYIQYFQCSRWPLSAKTHHPSLGCKSITPPLPDSPPQPEPDDCVTNWADLVG